MDKVFVLYFTRVPYRRYHYYRPLPLLPPLLLSSSYYYDDDYYYL